MTFAVSAEAYDRFMGRFSRPLAGALVDWVGVEPGSRVLDVGSGPGALSAALVDRLGPGLVAAADPMPVFVDTLRERLPGVTAVVAGAEDLPWDDATYDASIANLVIPFMSDAHAGVREMARVTRPGGLVAATVWQHGDGVSPLTPFWDGVHVVDAAAEDEALILGANEGELSTLFAACGLPDVRTGALTVSVDYDAFEDWWDPFTYGVGPAGAYLSAQDAERQRAIRDACAELLGPVPFAVPGAAWCVVATVP